MYILIRATHVLFGALWVGIAVFSALFLTPMMRDLGPDAAKAGASLERRGLIVAMPIIAGLTLLSGFWLYWRFTGGFTPEGAHTHAGMAYGTGGLLALISFLIGALVISRSMIGARKAAAAAATTTDAGERGRLLGRAAALQGRAASAGVVIAVLLVITIVLMAIGLYL
jgi:hypothetical protein